MTFVNNTGSGNPVFDYSSRDYVSIYSDLVARIPIYLPEWTSTSPSDFGIVMIQMYAYVGDILHYYIDRLAGEAFIQTATQPSSIVNLAAMLDYQPTLASGATVSLSITASSTITSPIVIAPGTQFTTTPTINQPAVVFQTVADSEQTSPGSQVIAPGATLTGVLAVQGTTYTSLPNTNNNWEAFGIPFTVTTIPIMAVSNGSINQAYSFFYSPVSANSFYVYVDLGTGPEQWTYVTSLINFGPYDRVFSNFVDGNNVMWVQFGDGINGYVPPLGSPMYCTYQVGLGTTGNVGAGTVTSPVSAAFGISGVTNPVAASGGDNPESLASIQINAPASLRTLNRAVTVSDFGTLAVQVPGVQWASAIEATYQIVNLFICPFGGGAPSTLLQVSVENYINALAMANTTTTIYPPTYPLVDITVNIQLYDSYDKTAVTNAVHAALANLLALSNTGFGFRVSVGLVYQTILAVPGVNYAVVTQLNREVWANLTQSISDGEVVTQLHVTPLPEDINPNDLLILADPILGHTTTVPAVSSASAGSTTIPVSFTATATQVFSAGSTVQDIGQSGVPIVQDAVMLANEIPLAGTLTFNVRGGLPSPSLQVFTFTPAGI